MLYFEFCYLVCNSNAHKIMQIYFFTKNFQSKKKSIKQNFILVKMSWLFLPFFLFSFCGIVISEEYYWHLDTLENKTEIKKGHLRQIGMQHNSEGHVDVLYEFPSTIHFFEKYVLASQPVVFKNAANHMPAFKLWTDEYLRNVFGDVKCAIEEGKKENRSENLLEWTLKRFLDHYKSSDIYMVNSLPASMRADLRLLPLMSCGGFEHVISDVVMWFSSGGTKSVLHLDNMDNINCLFSGEKELYMAHWKYRPHFDFDADDLSHSKVDVDAVDLNKYPGIAHVPWWEAKMEAGDCLFIPAMWYHQVRSFSDNQRNMAVNLWFYPMKNLNFTECEIYKENVSLSLDKLTLRNLNSIKFILKLDMKVEEMSRLEMAKVLLKHFGDQSDTQTVKSVLRIIDKNKDKLYSMEEIDLLTEVDLRFLSQFFPGFIGYGDSVSQEGNREESLIASHESDLNVENEVSSNDGKNEL